MERKALLALLTRHGIEYRTAGGRIMAGMGWTADGGTRSGVEWSDVTDWKRAQLLRWLGY